MKITLAGPEGDTVHLTCRTLTPEWTVGMELNEQHWTSGEPSHTVTLAGLDSIRKDFPLPDFVTGEGVVALRSPSGGRATRLAARGLRLDPPEWARAVELYAPSGARLLVLPLREGAPASLPARSGAPGPVLLRYLPASP